MTKPRDESKRFESVRAEQPLENRPCPRRLEPRIGSDLRSAISDARGAIYVEFLIVFLPMFSLFMALVQLAFVQTANLVTKHAAIQAARSAIVVLPDDPAYYGNVGVNKVSGDRLTVIENAARGRLIAVSTAPDFNLRFPSAPGAEDSKVQYQRDDIVRVRLTFNYPCKIPIGNRLVCGLVGAKKALKAEAALPLQGAGWEY